VLPLPVTLPDRNDVAGQEPAVELGDASPDGLVSVDGDPFDAGGFKEKAR
jgi:hypothetical protein